MTPAEFRAVLPAFASTTLWPDPDVQAALTSSATYIGVTEWDTFYSEAVANWVADRLVTDKTNLDPMASRSGMETLKMVGREMVQRDGRNIAMTMANPYLLTSYGRRYVYLQGLVFGGTTISA